jgi:hypothetical protein
MSYQTLVGAKFFMSTGLAGAVALNSISNGAPPVATTGAAHGGIDNDEYLVLTSWDDFNETVARIDSLSATTFSIPGYDSSDVNWYPPASSGGTVQKISGWQEIGQVLGITPNGGDAKFEEVNPFDRRNGIKIPTGFSAASLEMTLGWDRSRTDQQLLQVASRSAGKRAFKFVLPGGIYGYAYGTVSASGLPVFETIMKQKVSVTMNGMFTTFG